MNTHARWHRLALMLCGSLTALSAFSQEAALPAVLGVAQGPKAYVSIQDAGIARIDLSTLAVEGQIGLAGAGPRGVGITADGRLLVVAVREAGELQLIDLGSNTVQQRIAIGKNPEFVRVRGHLAFVSYEPSSTGTAPKPGQAAAQHAAVKDDDDKEPAQIAVVDLNKAVVLRRILGGAETEGIEITPDGQRIVVTNEADDNLTVHEVRTGKRLKVIDIKRFGSRPRGIKVSPDGQTYVTSLEFANKVLVMDKAFKPLRTVNTGAAPYGLAFDRSGQRLFVAAARDKVINVFDARTDAKLADIPVGERCWHFSFSPDDKQLLVACGRSKDIVVVDAQSYQVLQKLPAGGTPWGLVTFPKAFGSLDQP